MAVILNKYKPEQQNQQQVQQPAQTTMAAGPASSGVGQQIQPQNQQQGQQFTNIRQFLGANQQAGSQLAGGLVKEKTKTEQAIGQNQTQAADIGKAVNAARGEYAANTEAAKKDITETGGQSFINPPAPATPAAPSPNDTFARLTQGGTAATSEFQKSKESTLRDYQKNLGNLESQGQKLNTSSGRADLLQNMLNAKGNYQAGKSALDQMFLQKQGGQQIGEAVKDIKSKFPSLRSALDTTSTALGQNITDLKETANKSQEEINKAIGETQTNTEADLATAASNLSQENKRKYTLMQKYLGGLEITPEELTEVTSTILPSLGLKAGQSIYDLNPLDFLKAGNLEVTKNQVMTPQQEAKLKALGILSGTSDKTLTREEQGSAFNLDPKLIEQLAANDKKFNTELDKISVSNVYDKFLPGIGGLRAVNPMKKDTFDKNDINEIKSALALYDRNKDPNDPYENQDLMNKYIIPKLGNLFDFNNQHARLSLMRNIINDYDNQVKNLTTSLGADKKLRGTNMTAKQTGLKGLIK